MVLGIKPRVTYRASTTTKLGPPPLYLVFKPMGFMLFFDSNDHILRPGGFNRTHFLTSEVQSHKVHVNVTISILPCTLYW